MSGLPKLFLVGFFTSPLLFKFESNPGNGANGEMGAIRSEGMVDSLFPAREGNFVSTRLFSSPRLRKLEEPSELKL